ncbi:MAG: DNA polymerase III subunit gamma/tau [Bacteroidota bacterium]|nr:DNA polymerase III subunit gamma/tau [Bacteroidota bacterium]MDP4217011.1 DNA polymerase III subunit gamma/tau [Bacteroidota bacterium]MDP4245818.1 DNA polymerase III subunit gamma/tau [Bacteroidota bacterium]MDP4256661.1 DNA polymerase III subunit gamma/tau [Bacteroidota bacterium]
MDKFIVSARKYRPQDFSTVVGQSHITTTLKNAIRNNQLAHAFLFCGPRGVGKTTCARILAKTINCENVSAEGEACNRCHSCVSFNEGTSLNIHELDAASNNSVDDIRSLVDQVRFAPQAGRYKVYIIDEVHMLSSSAFNAFLKTLEEPPPYAIFILATTEKHKILPTILSRCQIFDFKRITIGDTVSHLREICDKESIGAEKAALHVIAQKSEGCMRDALSILDKIVSFTNGELTYQHTLEHLNILDADNYFRLLEAMERQNLSDALLLYDDINRKGFEGDLVLNGFAEFIRNLLVCRDEKVAALLEVVESFRDRYIATGRRMDAAYLISALNVLNEAELNYKAARNKRLHVELALIKLCYLGQALRSGAPQKKPFEGAKPVSFRNIPSMELVTAERPTRAKLLVEEQVEDPSRTVTRDRALFKEAIAPPEPVPVEETAVKDRSGEREHAATPSLASLLKIRQQFSSKSPAREEDTSIALTREALQEAWMAYTRQLREARSPATQSFERAVLKIDGGHSFEVITNNNLEQKFIEQEKRNLSDCLQRTFSNRMLTFTVNVLENQDSEDPEARPLSQREQFLRIAEQYPLVKELKDRLKLELDY